MHTKPFLAALFSVFTVHRLFRAFDRAAYHAGLPDSERTIGYAAPYIGMVVGSQLLYLLGTSDKYMVTAASLVLGLAWNVPLARAQRIVNRIAGDEAGGRNSRFSVGEVVVILLGSVVWVRMLMALRKPLLQH